MITLTERFMRKLQVILFPFCNKKSIVYVNIETYFLKL